MLNKNGILYFSCIEKEKPYSETQTSSDGKVTMEVNYHEASRLLVSLEKNSVAVLAPIANGCFHINGIALTLGVMIVD